jgi:arylsulfatase A-like enzyme
MRTPRFGTGLSHLVALLGATGLGILGAALPAAAQCTLKDASAIKHSASLAASCNDRKLRNGPGAVCKQAPPPACAGTLVDDAIALAYGANDPPAAAVDRKALKDQLGCQKQIGKAVARYLGSKLRYLLQGLKECDAEARSLKLLDALPKRCTVTVFRDASGVVLPDVGAQCDAAVGPVGTVVDPVRLRDCVLFPLSAGVAALTPAGPRHPNVVLVLSDDQRFDTLGPLHSVDGTTPVMQKVTSELVNQGVLFANSFVTTALCCPSRTSILSGKYSHTTGVHTNGGADGGEHIFHGTGDVSALPVWLQAAGYKTGLFGKYLNGYAGVSPYVPPGWDEFHAFRAPAYVNFTLAENGTEVLYNGGEYSTDTLRDKVVAFIDAHAGAEPFFVEFTPYAPHAPATPAPRHVGTFAGVAHWRPPNYATPPANGPAWVEALNWDTRDCASCTTCATCTDCATCTTCGSCAPATNCDTCSTDTFRQMQLECLQAVDEAVDAIVQELTAKGVLDDTLIIYASDNGYSWGSHRWKPKQCPYEECMRVPLVVRDPVLAPAPRTEAGPGLNIDYAELIAELTGALPDPGVEGRSLKRLLCGIDKTWRTDILNEHWNGVIPTNAQVRGVFGGKTWKYVEYDTGESELYDLDADPSELNNVTGDPANSALKGTLATRLRQIDPMWPPPPAPMAVQVRPGPDYENDDEFD